MKALTAHRQAASLLHTPIAHSVRQFSHESPHSKTGPLGENQQTSLCPIAANTPEREAVNLCLEMLLVTGSHTSIGTIRQHPRENKWCYFQNPIAMSPLAPKRTEEGSWGVTTALLHPQAPALTRLLSSSSCHTTMLPQRDETPSLLPSGPTSSNSRQGPRGATQMKHPRTQGGF